MKTRHEKQKKVIIVRKRKLIPIRIRDTGKETEQNYPSDRTYRQHRTQNSIQETTAGEKLLYCTVDNYNGLPLIETCGEDKLLQTPQKAPATSTLITTESKDIQAQSTAPNIYVTTNNDNLQLNGNIIITKKTNELHSADGKRRKKVQSMACVETTTIKSQWYKNNAMISLETIMSKIGFCPVTYPKILLNGERKRSIAVKEYEEHCIACKYDFQGGDRLVYLDNGKQTGEQCPHKYCEKCAYKWFFQLPTPEEGYMMHYLVKHANKNCGKCAAYGRLTKAIFGKKIQVENTSIDEEWVEGESLPKNKVVWGLHQVPQLKICNYITNKSLLDCILKMEKDNPKGIPFKVDDFPGEIENAEVQLYNTYRQAIYTTFKCSICDKTKFCYEKFGSENCSNTCIYMYCIDCSAVAVNTNYGTSTRRNATNTKYLNGWVKCSMCTTPEGRLINKLTSQYFKNYNS